TITVTVSALSIISRDEWSIWYVDSEELLAGGWPAGNVFDGDTSSFWHTEWVESDPEPPHEIQINLGARYDIFGFYYLPRQISANGRIKDYEFYVSVDGVDWGSPVAAGTFPNSAAEQEVLFSGASGQYIRLIAKNEVNGNPWITMAEFNILGVVPYAEGDNSAPQGVIDEPAADVTIMVGESVYFEGTGTDPENNIPLTYLWNFEDPAIEDFIDAVPGDVQFNTTGSYMVRFTVTDSLGLSDPTPATRTITVNVTDVNEAPTDISLSNNTVSENEPADTTVGTFTTVDPDSGDTHTYSLVAGIGDTNNDMFTIASGQLQTAMAFNFEDQNSYSIRVRSTDSGTPAEFFEEQFTINITDVNEAPTADDDSFAVSENANNGDIVGQVSASDPDEDMLSYSITAGNGDGVFAVNSTTGQITVSDNSTLDAAITSSYILTVLVEDNAIPSLNDTATITVTVSALSIISRDEWSIWYVDSEELLAGGWPAGNVFDGDTSTMWHTEWSEDDPVHPHEIQIDLGDVYEIDGFLYLPRQDGANGRIEMHEFYVSIDGETWGDPVATGFFANNSLEQECLFPRVSGRYVRLVALSEVNGRPWTAIAEINIVGAPFSGNYAPDGAIDTPYADLTINVGEGVDFTGEATDPDGPLPLSYVWRFDDPAISDRDVEDPGTIFFNNAGTYVVTFTVTDNLGRSDTTPATRIIQVQDGSGGQFIPKNTWILQSVDSENQDYPATNSFDDYSDTFWHTEWGENETSHPHEITLNLGSAYEMNSFRYLPRQAVGPDPGYAANGRIDSYHFYVSADGKNWGSAVTLGNFADDFIEKTVLFTPIMGQFVRLVALSETQGLPYTIMAEISIEGQCNTPYVYIIDPPTNDVQQGPDLEVNVSVCLNSDDHAGWG
ncbi:MAG: discoidin domain-containing protein, partial [candidate division Zixibacteria bacterium]|nr:discoidin domain-containing protein [candidate division Zixibacteria bacterium]